MPTMMTFPIIRMFTLQHQRQILIGYETPL
jgi:hypothetical protein